jgi:hypothetical protein
MSIGSIATAAVTASAASVANKHSGPRAGGDGGGGESGPAATAGAPKTAPAPARGSSSPVSRNTAAAARVGSSKAKPTPPAATRSQANGGTTKPAASKPEPQAAKARKFQPAPAPDLQTLERDTLKHELPVKGGAWEGEAQLWTGSSDKGERYAYLVTRTHSYPLGRVGQQDVDDAKHWIAKYGPQNKGRAKGDIFNSFAKDKAPLYHAARELLSSKGLQGRIFPEGYVELHLPETLGAHGEDSNLRMLVIASSMGFQPEPPDGPRSALGHGRVLMLPNNAHGGRALSAMHNTGGMRIGLPVHEGQAEPSFIKGFRNARHINFWSNAYAAGQSGMLLLSARALPRYVANTMQGKPSHVVHAVPFSRGSMLGSPAQVRQMIGEAHRNVQPTTVKVPVNTKPATKSLAGSASAAVKSDGPAPKGSANSPSSNQPALSLSTLGATDLGKALRSTITSINTTGQSIVSHLVPEGDSTDSLIRFSRSVAQINASGIEVSGRHRNCEFCAVALDQSFANDRPMQALPILEDGRGTQLRMQPLMDAYGKSFRTLSMNGSALAALNAPSLGSTEQALSTVYRELADAGSGARGIVRLKFNDGFMHFFNAANIDGHVALADGQTDRMLLLVAPEATHVPEPQAIAGRNLSVPTKRADDASILAGFVREQILIQQQNLNNPSGNALEMLARFYRGNEISREQFEACSHDIINRQVIDEFAWMRTDPNNYLPRAPGGSRTDGTP